MYLTPLLRANRAIAATFICPNHPLQTIAFSEIISVFAPLVDSNFLPKILGATLALIYNPQFAFFYIKSYNKMNTITMKKELILIILINIIFTGFYIF